MQFKYEVSVKPEDFFWMSMSHTYRSIIGVVNIIFTLAMSGLIIAFWNKASDFVQVLMGFAVLLFPVIQPVMVYLKSKSEVAAIPAGLKLTIDDSGVLVELSDKHEKILWKRVSGLILERNMIILRVDKRNGYFLANHVLKDERDELISFIKAHMA